MFETIICAIMFVMLTGVVCTMFCKNAVNNEEIGIDWGRQK